MKGLQKRENKTGDLQTANPLFFIRLRNLFTCLCDRRYVKAGKKDKNAICTIRLTESVVVDRATFERAGAAAYRLAY